MDVVDVYSLSRKKPVWRKCRLAKTPFERMRGIMFSGKVGSPLIIQFASAGRRRNALHSFVCPPFDAVFLDSDGRVVEAIRSVEPNRPLIVPAFPCALVIELAPGEAGKVRLGEKLELRPSKSELG